MSIIYVIKKRGGSSKEPPFIFSGITWIIWERRKLEGSGKFPNGGWARIDSIKSGKWKPWHPRPVLIPAESFMEKDHDKQSHWITLAPGMAIQALLTERDGEQKVYVVTEETLAEYHLLQLVQSSVCVQCRIRYAVLYATDAIEHQAMQMDVKISRRTKALNQCNRTGLCLNPFQSGLLN